MRRPSGRVWPIPTRHRITSHLERTASLHCRWLFPYSLLGSWSGNSHKKIGNTRYFRGRRSTENPASKASIGSSLLRSAASRRCPPVPAKPTLTVEADGQISTPQLNRRKCATPQIACQQRNRRRPGPASQNVNFQALLVVAERHAPGSAKTQRIAAAASTRPRGASASSARSSVSRLYLPPDREHVASRRSGLVGRNPPAARLLDKSVEGCVCRASRSAREAGPSNAWGMRSASSRNVAAAVAEWRSAPRCVASEARPFAKGEGFASGLAGGLPPRGQRAARRCSSTRPQAVRRASQGIRTTNGPTYDPRARLVKRRGNKNLANCGRCLPLLLLGRTTRGSAPRRSGGMKCGPSPCAALPRRLPTSQRPQPPDLAAVGLYDFKAKFSIGESAVGRREPFTSPEDSVKQASSADNRLPLPFPFGRAR
jgi:hypothetical protein